MADLSCSTSPDFWLSDTMQLNICWLALYEQACDDKDPDPPSRTKRVGRAKPQLQYMPKRTFAEKEVNING